MGPIDRLKFWYWHRQYHKYQRIILRTPMDLSDEVLLDILDERDKALHHYHDIRTKGGF